MQRTVCPLIVRITSFGSKTQRSPVVHGHQPGSGVVRPHLDYADAVASVVGGPDAEPSTSIVVGQCPDPGLLLGVQLVIGLVEVTLSGRLR